MFIYYECHFWRFIFLKPKLLFRDYHVIFCEKANQAIFQYLFLNFRKKQKARDWSEVIEVILHTTHMYNAKTCYFRGLESDQLTLTCCICITGVGTKLEMVLTGSALNPSSPGAVMLLRRALKVLISSQSQLPKLQPVHITTNTRVLDCGSRTVGCTFVNIWKVLYTIPIFQDVQNLAKGSRGHRALVNQARGCEAHNSSPRDECIVTLSWTLKHTYRGFVSPLVHYEATYKTPFGKAWRWHILFRQQL